MAAPKKIIPSRSLHLHLPEDLQAQVDLRLFSEAENRIPKGAYQKFFSDLLREHFTARPLDLAPFIPSLQPGTHIVQAPSHVILRLLDLLKGTSA